MSVNDENADPQFDEAFLDRLFRRAEIIRNFPLIELPSSTEFGDNSGAPGLMPRAFLGAALTALPIGWDAVLEKYEEIDDLPEDQVIDVLLHKSPSLSRPVQETESVPTNRGSAPSEPGGHAMQAHARPPARASSAASNRSHPPGPPRLLRTLAAKVWESHVVRRADGEPDLLYIDLHLLHEVTSPQAFDGMRRAGRAVRRTDLTVATIDLNSSTMGFDQPLADPVWARQLEVLAANCAEFGVPLYPMGLGNQGIVHVIGPEQGLTQPGMTIVCGDSHTSTHGAFGALAFGIGTSEVEHVLATQTLAQRRPANMAVTIEGDLPAGVTAKDVMLALIGKIGTGGGVSHVVEYRGSTIRSLSMEGRMTICNMSIETGARAGMVAPDNTTFAWLEGRPHVPTGADWEQALDYWRSLVTDEGAVFDKEVHLDATGLRPHVSWGTNPSQVVPIDGTVPEPDTFTDPREVEAARRALAYMGLRAGTPIREIPVDTVFIGSCTNSRIEDLRTAALIVAGRRVHAGMRAMVVTGSMRVKADAESEGLDRIFTAAGFEWRSAGCSMCLGMNPDKLAPQDRCASTSNRTCAGRQGQGGRTHLVSPTVAAATAVAGHFASPEEL